MSVSVRQVPGAGAKQLQVLIKGLANKQGKVGWFSDAKYENGTPVAYIAQIQELGSPAQSTPPRSFMRTTVMEKRSEWSSLIKDAAKAVLSGAMTPDKAMGLLTLQAKGDVQTKIADIREPELSPITLGLRKVKLGRVKGLGPDVTGRTVGIVAAMLSAGTLTTDGVSNKPLIEPAGIPGGGTLFTSIAEKVEG